MPDVADQRASFSTDGLWNVSGVGTCRSDSSSVGQNQTAHHSSIAAVRVRSGSLRLDVFPVEAFSLIGIADGQIVQLLVFGTSLATTFRWSLLQLGEETGLLAELLSMTCRISCLIRPSPLRRLPTFSPLRNFSMRCVRGPSLPSPPSRSHALSG